MSATLQSTHKHTNRLAQENSPYLLQHAHNPVDWYPWGPEAFELARSQNKPIFLSVGYSTCYWCHVMERQSFESEAIAKELNQRFVSIKVDREERPDVDQLYMTALQVLTRHGGWPMSIFLTPELEPFYGGTYFHPTDMHGRPGFVTVLRAIEDAYRNRPDEVKKTTVQLTKIMQQLARPRSAERSIRIDQQWVAGLIDRSISDYDPVYGGFGSAPKFPRQTLLELLLLQNSIHPDDRFKKMLVRTLDAMACGGIRDQLGGGFHRYSTDAQWLVPHFEIMLYDNALLGWIYSEAYRQFGEERFAAVARGIFDFALREMTSPQGGFYTAFDAEVEAQEGLSYLWTRDEAIDILREKLGTGAEQEKAIEKFCRAYGLADGPNFADPHCGNGQPDKNILFLASGDTFALLDRQFAEMRNILYEARRHRPQPMLDTKILTSWNGLMIRGLAHGGMVLKESRYVQAAAKAAKFLLEHHKDATGSLLRTSREGSEPKFTGALDDYVFLADALLALDVADSHGGWRKQAERVASKMKDEFGSGEAFFYISVSTNDLLVRQMVGSDSPLPSGNGVAAQVMLQLDEPQIARDVLGTFAQALEDQAEGMSSLVVTAVKYLERHEPFTATASDPQAERALSPREMALRVVSVRPTWKSDLELRLELNTTLGFHVNAHEPAAGLIATTLSAADAAEIIYPPGVMRRLQFAEGPIPVYDGSVAITVRFAKPPKKAVAVQLTYQACDETSCLPVVTRTVDVPAPK